jgi:hypothetical protein
MLNTSNATRPIPVHSVASATESYSSQCQYVSTMSIRCSNAIFLRSAENDGQTNRICRSSPTEGVNREPYVWFLTQRSLILGEPTRFPAFARLGGWFMAPSRAAAYRHHAQECLRLADLMTLVGMAQEQHRCTAGGQAALVPPQDYVLHHHSWIGHGSALP